MTAPWAAPARSRWFDRPPPADETPVERALRRDLLTAVEWAEGLVQAPYDGFTTDSHVHAHDLGLVQVGWIQKGHLADDLHGDTWHTNCCRGTFGCQPVYVVREAR